MLAAKRSIVTVEEIVDELHGAYNDIVLPHWVISAVCEVPRGAHPSYAQGYYKRDNRFYTEWDNISRERDSFTAWINDFVFGTPDHAGFMKKFDASRAAAGKEAAHE